MSQGSSRFRTGHVTAPATPAERVRRHLDDGTKLVETCSELVEELARTPDADALLEVLEVVRGHEDPHRVYLVHKLAGAALVVASGRHDASGDFGWAPYYDLLVAALLPLLERQPAEPELLNLVGLAYYELGDTSMARRVFEAIREIEPEHLQARANLKACKERARRGVGVPKPSDGLTRRSRDAKPAVKRLVERATRLGDPTVSLIMIVKDEEEMLPGCLDAVRDHVDEIVVVDTGSTDATREIALERGAKVVDFAWTGSFSDARNVSIEHATCDWVLYLDADEHLVDDDGRHIRRLVRKSWVEGFYLIETHFTGEMELGGQAQHMAMRLFQRRPQYRWEGIIHEQKTKHFPTYLGERFQNTPIRINHYGYLKNVVEDRSKRERNLELLLQQAEGGADAFCEFNIGSEYGAMGDWGRARPHFERALELSEGDHGWQNQQFAPMMVSRLVTARRGTGDDQAALDLIERSLGWWPDFTDLVFERALIFLQRGDFAQAEEEARRCIAMGDAPAKYVAIAGKGSYQARGLLASVLRQRNDVSGARHELEASLEEAPFFLSTVLELADVMLQTDPPDEVAASLDERLGERAHGAVASMLMATAFYEAGHLDHADRLYERVLAVSPDNSAALIGLAELRLAQRRPDDALELAGRVKEGDLLATRGARTEFLAAIVAGRADALARPLQVITDAGYLAVGERAFYSAWRARVSGGSAVVAANDPDAVSAIVLNLEALAKVGATDEFEVLAGLLGQVIPDERERRLTLGALYLRRRFADMALEEFMAVAERFGPDARSLTGLGKVATMKEMWDDARVFLTESLNLDATQADARRLLDLIDERHGPGPVATG